MRYFVRFLSLVSLSTLVSPAAIASSSNVTTFSCAETINLDDTKPFVVTASFDNESDDVEIQFQRDDIAGSALGAYFVTKDENGVIQYVADFGDEDGVLRVFTPQMQGSIEYLKGPLAGFLNVLTCRVVED